jgi:peptide/nickel transport system substrate-binding protein
MLAATLFGAGCSKVDTSGSTPQAGGAKNAWTHPGEFVYAENQDAKSLNPMLATGASVGDLSYFLFSYAIRYDDKARPVPDALREIPTVENGDVSKDGLTLKYKLRPNIFWHDGVRMTCRDLAFTWQAVMNPANNTITHDGYSSIERIDCSDPLVAVVHMKRVYAPFLQQLWGVNGNAPIMPAHILAKYNDASGSFNTAPFQGAPIGSGPFEFVRWDRGQQVVMKAFDRYFKGRPKLDRVTFKILPDDSTLVAQLKTHEIDMAARIGANVYPEAANIPGPRSSSITSISICIDRSLPTFACDTRSKWASTVRRSWTRSRTGSATSHRCRTRRRYRRISIRVSEPFLTIRRKRARSWTRSVGRSARMAFA